jgi:PIN domain nuclease of toxin-antitoxin system
VKLLLDTHVLLWAAAGSKKLSSRATRLISDPKNELYFSAASLWEIVIKRARPRSGIRINPATLRHRLLKNGYTELAITGSHALAIAELPAIHKDPFDRALAAQSLVEDMLLLTADDMLLQYPCRVQKI